MTDEFGVKQLNQKISYEYIRGLVEGEGCFSFCTSPNIKNGKRSRIPAFIISMHERDENLLRLVRDTLGLKNKVYNYKSFQKDGIKRGRKVVLIVREFKQLKDIIIPFLYKKLVGHKRKQFDEWLEKIGNDPQVPDRFKSLYRLYKWGIYDKLPKFKEKFND